LAGVHLNNTKFATIRFGNVFETRGNVFEIWNNEKEKNIPLSLTDPDMKRYFFTKDDAVNFMLNCLPNINEGEIFVPKMKQYSIKELADKISKKQKVIGLRRGEKMEEILLTKEELESAKEKNNMWIISPYKK
jgi:UDP-N-acetylglucosamine 4,6-dehydratase/5-epimerase